MTAKIKKIYKSISDEIIKRLAQIPEEDGVVYAYKVEEVAVFIEENTIPDPVVKKYDYRCVNCGRLAFRAYLPESAKVAHRCAKCGSMLTFSSNGKKVEIEHETANSTDKKNASGKRDRNKDQADSK